jgi:hypothetical protein
LRSYSHPPRVTRTFLALIACLLLAPSAADAYFVDISITGAGRVYETTDANELDEHCLDDIEGFASPSNTPTGSLGASCRAGSASGDYGWNWVVRYVAEPAAGYRFDGWHSDGRTTPGPVLCDGSNGSSDYSGSACQFATSADLQVRARFVDDTAPAMSSLSGPNQPVNGAATFSFSAASDSTFRLFECRIGGVHEWQTCSSGYAPNLSTGSYTLQVRAVDWTGNRSGESTWNWTVDKIAPETGLAPSGPSGTVASSSATFEFNSNESGSFICSLNGAAVGCGSPKAYTNLAPGDYTFTVRARDLAGNEDSSPAVRTWTVDTVAPETTLADSGPTGSTTATSAEFAFSSEPGVTFRCQLDSQAVEVGCSSPRGFSGLVVGAHTFKVWATDAAGNADPTPATRTWTVTSADTGAGSSTGTTPPTTGSGTPDTTRPVAVLSFAGQRLSRVLKRGLAGSASTTEAGTLVLDVLYRGKKVATAKRAAAQAGSFKLVARFTARGKRALGRVRSARLTLRLTATDAAGNKTVKKKTITLKR